jgi:hypothetical protein
VPLSDGYVVATTATQRAVIAATADGPIIQLNSVSVGGVPLALGVLMFSLAMFTGVFQQCVAYLGIVTGVVGIVCERLRPILGAWYGIYGILVIWMLAIAWKLFRQSLTPAQTVREEPGTDHVPGDERGKRWNINPCG